MWTVTFGKTLCGVLVFACITVGAACQRSATNATITGNTTASTNTTPTPTPALTESTFEGVSDNGDIQEALRKAIDAAHESTRLVKVLWRLEEISGEHGGFVPPRNRITVKISVKAP